MGKGQQEDKSKIGCEYREDALSIVVIGASGDLAKKKTYPSLMALYKNGYFSEQTTICGYARTKHDDEGFRDSMRPLLAKHNGDERTVDAFLSLCFYTPGGYDDAASMRRAVELLRRREAGAEVANRLFYFAIPPNVFSSTGKLVSKEGQSPTGWTRVVIEKPFGRDLESFEKLSAEVSAEFAEPQVYRIDHYLGKEMTQNLMALRFANVTLEPIWNFQYVASVNITFKEDFGTGGRGGYFDKFGIIRDVMQNHLLQLLCLLAMEPPARFVDAEEVGGADNRAAKVEGEVAGRRPASDGVRDEKRKVLECLAPVDVREVVLGQYVRSADGGGEAYTDEHDVPDDSTTPTFAAMVLRVQNTRWSGVPFILRAGKGLNERKTEIRVQFREPAAGPALFGGVHVPRNELVMRLQPDEAIYLKTNVKTPGLSKQVIATELDLSYGTRFRDAFDALPDAYTRLLLDVLRGDSSSFVRDDELRESWRVFTPLLQRLEHGGAHGGAVKPIPYAYGSRGPEQADELAKRVGFLYDNRYHYY